MKVRTIECDDEGGIFGVTVDMSLPELLIIAKMIGATNHTDRDQVMRGGGTAGSSVWDALSGVVNRFYDDGVDEAARGVSS